MKSPIRSTSGTVSAAGPVGGGSQRNARCGNWPSRIAAEAWSWRRRRCLEIHGWPGPLREWLRVAQGDRCAHLGCDVPLSAGTVELCHVVSRGPLALGFLHGNLYAGHKGCNAEAAAISPVLGPDVLDFSLIAETFPGMTELIRWHAAR